LEGEPLYPIWRVTHRLTPTAELFQGYCLGDNLLIIDIIIYNENSVKAKGLKIVAFYRVVFLYNVPPKIGFLE
jgi:hypothetical protein